MAARHVLQRVPDWVYYAGLDCRGGEDRLDRLGESLEPVDAADQDVSHAALLQIGQDLHPELRALVGLKPHAQNFALPVHPDRQRQIASPALDSPAVTDLQDQRVEDTTG
jgi:hypothetical protein